MFSAAPDGAWFVSTRLPTAGAVGYYLPPLRGLRLTWIVHNLWLIPALPLLAGGLSALAKQRQRTFAASLAIGSMGLSFGLSCWAFVETLGGHAIRQVHNFDWFVLGETTLQIGWVLD